MINQELIETDLGFILASLGKPVINAAKWQEELGDSAPTEQEILAKKAEIDAQRDILINGFDTGLGFRLDVSVPAQTRLTTLEASSRILNLTDSDITPIWDINKQKHLITVAQLKQVLAAYTIYCLSIEP